MYWLPFVVLLTIVLSIRSANECVAIAEDDTPYYDEPCAWFPTDSFKEDQIFYKTGAHEERCIFRDPTVQIYYNNTKVWVETKYLDHCFEYPTLVVSIRLAPRSYKIIELGEHDTLEQYHVKCHRCDFLVMDEDNYERFRSKRTFTDFSKISQLKVDPEFMNTPHFDVPRKSVVVFNNPNHRSMDVKYYLDVRTATPTPTPTSSKPPVPTTQAPTTLAPTTKPPTTTAPPTLAPTTTVAPTTAAPTTLVPTMSPTTTTRAPATTTAIPTQVPTTTIPVTTYAPSTQTPTTSPQPTPTPTQTEQPTTQIPTTQEPTISPVTTTLAPTAPVTTVEPTTSTAPTTTTPTASPSSTNTPTISTTVDPYPTVPYVDDEGSLTTFQLVIIFVSVGGGTASMAVLLILVLVRKLFIRRSQDPLLSDYYVN